MREIKFRGKSNIFGWIYGCYAVVDGNAHIFEEDDLVEDGHHIRQESDRPTWVDENTIGQYTGLKDANGKEIYEGDIVDLYIPKNVVGKPEHRLRKVIWKDSGFNITNKDGDCIMDRVSSSIELIYTVIGNIHDNPELL